MILHTFSSKLKFSDIKELGSNWEASNPVLIYLLIFIGHKCAAFCSHLISLYVDIFMHPYGLI